MKNEEFDEVMGMQANNHDEYFPQTGDIDQTSLGEQKKERYRQNTRYRSRLTIWVMIIVPTWLSAVFILVAYSIITAKELPSSVLNTLLATTTVNILGLAYIVLKGMFPQGRE